MAATDPDRYITRWNLEPDGKSFSTRSSALFPVRQAGLPAILKIAKESEEWRGGRLMAWWQGEGAARVLAEDDGVLLVPTLADDDASTVIGVIDAASMQCLALLHAPQVIPFGFHAAWAP